MRKRVRPLPALAAVLVLALGCAGPVFINGKYALPRRDGLRLALLPCTVTFKSYEEFTDGEFLDRFTADGGADDCLAPGDIRAKLLDNRPYAEAVNRLFGIEYAREDYLAPPSLTDAFPAAELEFIRFCLDKADLVLVPVEFNVTTAGAGMTGSATFRVYDLATGALIMENSHSASAPQRGGPGVMAVTKQLVAAMAADYAKFVVK